MEFLKKSQSFLSRAGLLCPPEARNRDSRPEAAAKVSLGRITRDWSGVQWRSWEYVCKVGSITMSPDIDHASPWLMADTFDVSEGHGGDVSVLTVLQETGQGFESTDGKVRGEQRPPNHKEPTCTRDSILA